MAREKIIPAETVEEEIIEAVHDYVSQTVTIKIAQGRTDPGTGRFVPDSHPLATREKITFANQDYDDLMAANGNGKTPGKPQGAFDQADLWTFVDDMKARALARGPE